METKMLARVNNVSIIMIENGDNYVPIRPICEALGISVQGQIEKIKNDEILSPTVKLSLMVGADKKERELFCLPLKFIFGWLFTINPQNVKPEAQETVARYKLECYNMLYEHFAEQSIFLKQKQKALDEKIDTVERLRANFKNTRAMLNQATAQLHHVREMTLDAWRDNKNVWELPFPIEETETETES